MSVYLDTAEHAAAFVERWHPKGGEASIEPRERWLRRGRSRPEAAAEMHASGWSRFLPILATAVEESKELHP